MKLNRYRIKYTLFSSIVCIGILFSSCKKDAIFEAEELADRMVLVYIGANNDLSYDAQFSVQNMIEGVKRVSNGVLVIFIKTQSSSSLIRIRPTSLDEVTLDTLARYSMDGNTSNPVFLKQVISDARKNVPAKSYGLVLWSHATSWAPPTKMSTKSFGSDNFREMDIKDLRDALPDDLDFIIFDACSMASIEVLYEFKDKTKYIIASPAEILSTSFPYHTMMHNLFGDSTSLISVATKFIEYYKALPGMYASATVSLINTEKLNDIVIATKHLLSTKSPAIDFNIHNIQSLDFQENGGVPAYDFISFLENNYSVVDYEPITQAIHDAVLYKGHTSSFFNIPITSYSGISVYLPQTDNEPLKDYYNSLSWAQDSGWNSLFY